MRRCKSGSWTRRRPRRDPPALYCFSLLVSAGLPGYHASFGRRGLQVQPAVHGQRGRPEEEAYKKTLIDKWPSNSTFACISFIPGQQYASYMYTHTVCISFNPVLDEQQPCPLSCYTLAPVYSRQGSTLPLKVQIGILHLVKRKRCRGKRQSNRSVFDAPRLGQNFKAPSSS